MIPAHLTPMVKLEIVVDDTDISTVSRMLESQGATGWTALPGLSGFGHHGRHQGRLLFNDKGGQTLLMAVVPPTVAEPIVAGIQELLANRPGVMFVSETFVSRPAYFGAVASATD